MPDFTVHKYTLLLEALMEQGYQFQTFEEYLRKPLQRTIILRHDVDDQTQNSLVLAKIESGFGLKGVYNFRIIPASWNERIIKKISELGHEIGYHYEELSICKGDFDKAITLFKLNLEKLRLLAPVSTITMHGSPRSRYDSRDLWKHYNYKELGLTGEPYFDVDFTRVLYLTDTGRRWDGDRVSIRDRVAATLRDELESKGYPLRNTEDIIKALKEKALPDAIMFTIHPQRWHHRKAPWLKELVMQNIKNVVKRGVRALNR